MNKSDGLSVLSSSNNLDFPLVSVEFVLCCCLKRVFLRVLLEDVARDSIITFLKVIET